MAVVEGAVQRELFGRLHDLQTFRDYEARLKAGAEADAMNAIRVAVTAAKSRGAAEAKAQALIQFFGMRGDRVPDHVFSRLNECQDVVRLNYWLYRAYRGETVGAIFPGPEASERS
jgi:hypothetical protein